MSRVTAAVAAAVLLMAFGGREGETVSRRFPIGRCIYCGSTEQPLTREHIIPRKLGGIWVLHDASCEACRAITGGLEREVLRVTLLGPRAVLGFPTDSGYPDVFPLRIVVPGAAEVDIAIPISDHPAVFLFQEFPPPRHLDTRPRPEGVVMRVRPVQIGGPPADDVAGRRAAELGTDRLSISATFHGYSYPRMIAKIAHCFAIARLTFLRWDLVETYLPSVILRESPEIARWVGCDGAELLRRGPHACRMYVDPDGEIHVRVRLFSDYETPEYVVVVGRTSGTSSAPAKL
jgi:HNH endonuclease